MSDKRKISDIMEMLFDVLYLITVITLGIYYIASASGTEKTIFGIMALLLGFGDSFHLVPRIASIVENNAEKYMKSLGTGKLITSITMTAFYVMLWHIALMHYNVSYNALTMIVYALAFVRIVLCLFPQNKWTKKNPPVSWGIYRNVPFALLGLAVLWIYFANMAVVGTPFKWMSLAVFLSFAFYIPVVLWVHKMPKLGMLMLPKSCAYIWIVCMGLMIK